MERDVFALNRIDVLIADVQIQQPVDVAGQRVRESEIVEGNRAVGLNSHRRRLAFEWEARDADGLRAHQRQCEGGARPSLCHGD